MHAEAASIVAGTDRTLTFSGHKTVVIPPDAQFLSDPIELKVPPAGSLAISIFISMPTTGSAIHYYAQQKSYVGGGDQTGAGSMNLSRSISAWAFLSGVDVLTKGEAEALVALGDSITDGSGSTMDANRGWPNILSDRLRDRGGGKKIAVLNAGIGGNLILRDGFSARLCTSALARFDRDVLAQAGIRYVVLLEGINDLGQGGLAGQESQSATAEDLIAGVKQIVERAHNAGLRVFGGTLTPFGGFVTKGYFTPEKEAQRKAIRCRDRLRCGASGSRQSRTHTTCLRQWRSHSSQRCWVQGDG